MAEMIVTDGGRETKRVVLDKPMMEIGRKKDNNLVLEDVEISRRHAQIEREGNRFFIRDLGSANGVIVNGAKISSRHELADMDKIEIGRFVLYFSEREGAEVSSDERTRVRSREALEKPAPGRSAEAPQAARGTQILTSPLTGKLIIESGDLRGREFEIWHGASVGRTKSNDIVLDDPTVSSNHARFQVADNTIRIADLGSTNGTFVNGEKVTDNKMIYHQDAVTFGKVLGKLVYLGAVKPQRKAETVASAPVTQKAKRWPYWVAAAALLIIMVVIGVLYNASQRGSLLERQVAAAEQQLTKHEFSSALQTASMVLRQNPGHVQAATLKNRAQQGLEAEKKYRNGLEALNQGNLEMAKSLFRDANQLYPGIPDVSEAMNKLLGEEELVSTADQYQAAGLLELARNQYLSVLKRNKNSTQALTGLQSLANVFYDKKNTAMAKQVCLDILTYQPSNVYALQMREKLNTVRPSEPQMVKRKESTNEIEGALARLEYGQAAQIAQEMQRDGEGSTANTYMNNVRSQWDVQLRQQIEQGDLAAALSTIRNMDGVGVSTPATSQYRELLNGWQQGNGALHEAKQLLQLKKGKEAEDKLHQAEDIFVQLSRQYPAIQSLESARSECEALLGQTASVVDNATVEEAKRWLAEANKIKQDHLDYANRPIDAAVSLWRKVVAALPTDHALAKEAQENLDRFSQK